MPRFNIAHVRQQGVDLIIVPLDDNFEWKTGSQQQAAIAELQSRAQGAGLRGTVVPVWSRSGRLRFIAPQPWHGFFSSLNMNVVRQNINRELYW